MASHGIDKFDRKYYRRFFEHYSEKEFNKYVNWADGWVRFLDRYSDIKKGSGRTLLELGASLGYFSRIFKDRGFNVWASDVSDYIVKKAGALQKDIKFLKIDIEKMKDLGKKFDFVVAFEVLEHLQDPEKALGNIRKLLKNDGTLIFSTPFPFRRSLIDPTHINVHGPSWWLKLGRKTGFRRRRMIEATFMPFLYRINRYFSFGLPVRLNLPFVNSTCFLIFEK